MATYDRVRPSIKDVELVFYIDKPDPYIVECGCHDGRDTRRFLELWPDCRILCFEPDPRPLLRENPPGFFKNIPGEYLDSDKVKLINGALSNYNGDALMFRSSGSPPNKNVKDWDHSGSLNKPTGHLNWSPWCTFPEEKQIKVHCWTLDSLQTPEIIDLMWVDVQGGQLAMIEGARETLAKTQVVFMECHKRPMYDGEPTQPELVKLMEELGFAPIALYEGYNFLFRRRQHG